MNAAALLAAAAAVTVGTSNAAESCDACSSGYAINSLSFTITVHDTNKAAVATVTVADASEPSNIYGTRSFAPGENFRIRSRGYEYDEGKEGKAIGGGSGSGFVVLGAGPDDSAKDRRSLFADDVANFVVGAVDSTMDSTLRHRRRKGPKAKGSAKQPKTPKANKKGKKNKKGEKAPANEPEALKGDVPGGDNGGLPYTLLITVNYNLGGGAEQIKVPGGCNGLGRLVIGESFGSVTLAGYTLDKGMDAGVQQGKIIQNQVNAASCDDVQNTKAVSSNQKGDKAPKKNRVAKLGANNVATLVQPHANAMIFVAGMIACVVLTAGVMLQRRQTQDEYEAVRKTQKPTPKIPIIFSNPGVTFTEADPLLESSAGHEGNAYY